MSLEEVEAEAPPPVADKRRHLKTQKSSVWSRRQQAVCVRRAYKSYGSKKNPNLILDGLNMTVPKGNIYGLLGASGCGKTTLLSCIVGRRRLDAGEIWVLGGKPGSKGSGVPGPRIGYMPQEVALYGEFTIRETMVYFGWIAGKTTPWVKDKIEFIVKLLQLPDMYKFVKNLSGGQQRRVSFAAALIHDPELMILDEPTVGLDPLLRQNIWDYLVKIAHDGNKTIIITTHYIDETRQAHMIGLMRGGRFLAEESPDSLMAKHACDSLEDVFLKLSKIQNQGKRRRSSFMQEVLGPTVEDPAAIDVTSEISGEFGDSVSNRSFRMSSTANDPATDKKPSREPTVEIKPDVVAEPATDLPPQEDVAWTWLDYIRVITPHRMKALLWKNVLWMWRNVPVMLFVILLPVVQIVLFCLTIGQDPRGLHLAVYNQELNNSHEPCIVQAGCNREMLSCRYLKHLRNRTIILDNYGDTASALDAVKRGHVWGMLQFHSNYSESLYQRIDKGKEASPMVIENSDIKIALDMSNQHIGQLLRRDIFFSFQSFAQEFLESCNYSAKLGGSPTTFMHPIYGPELPNFTDFAAPGVILTIIFFLAVALTSGAMLIERNDGMLERMLVSGITGSEILCSHVISQFLVMFGQSVMVIVFSFYVFSVTCEGSLVSVLVLTAMTGLCGMCFGFVVSSLCDNERTATYLALGSFLPIVMLCGIVWPIEGMHYLLKYMSFFLPLTQSTESLRSIMARGWGIDNPVVYYGFIATLIWILIFLCASILILKFKKG